MATNAHQTLCVALVPTHMYTYNDNKNCFGTRDASDGSTRERKKHAQKTILEWFPIHIHASERCSDQFSESIRVFSTSKPRFFTWSFVHRLISHHNFANQAAETPTDSDCSQCDSAIDAARQFPANCLNSELVPWHGASDSVAGIFGPLIASYEINFVPIVCVWHGVARR